MKPTAEVATLKGPDGVKFTVAVEMITPAIASSYLEANKRNRKMRKRHVDILTREMLAGDFQFTAQGITFSSAGNLLDGQHRLSALVAAGKSVPMLVFRGFPDKVQETIDSGAGRTVAENLMMIDGQALAWLLTRNLNVIARYWAEYRYKISLTQTRDLLKVIPLLVDQSRDDMSKLAPMFRHGTFIAPIGLALHLPKAKKIAQFHDAFTRGFGLHAKHPAHHLREHALGFSTERNRNGERANFKFTLDCIQQWMTKGEMSSPKPTGTGVVWLREQLPEIWSEVLRILKQS